MSRSCPVPARWARQREMLSSPWGLQARPCLVRVQMVWALEPSMVPRNSDLMRPALLAM